PDNQLKALVLFELGNCYQELGQGDRALAYLYNSLSDHPNPMLVQKKIQRIRRRLVRTAPAASIYTDGFMGKSLLRNNGQRSDAVNGGAAAAPEPRRQQATDGDPTPRRRRGGEDAPAPQ